MSFLFGYNIPITYPTSWDWSAPMFAGFARPYQFVPYQAFPFEQYTPSLTEQKSDTKYNTNFNNIWNDTFFKPFNYLNYINKNNCILYDELSNDFNTDIFCRSCNNLQPVKYKKENKIEKKPSLLADYNSTAGANLAKSALKIKELRDMANYEKGLCAQAIEEAFSDAGMGYLKRMDDAYMYTEQLKQNPKFKEISPDSISANMIPAGCVLIFDANTQGYGASGHIEISDGNGHGISDIITDLKTPSYLFIPV